MFSEIILQDKKTFDIAIEGTDLGRQLQVRVDEIRRELPNSLKRSGNVGVAKIDIIGLPSELKAHSSINFIADKGSIGFVLSKPKETRLFTTKSVDRRGFVATDLAYSREWDAEVKILEDIAGKILSKPCSGTIDLFTERLACASCSDVIMTFKEKFPAIQINVYTGKK